MNNLGKTDRESIVAKVLETVETKHFDPHFDKEKWRSTVEQGRDRILAAESEPEFEAALSDLVRAFGTPDAGFFNESSRKKVPKGLAARFQYCQPNECAPEHTQPSDAGDVMISIPQIPSQQRNPSVLRHQPDATDPVCTLVSERPPWHSAGCSGDSPGHHDRQSGLRKPVLREREPIDQP